MKRHGRFASLQLAGLLLALALAATLAPSSALAAKTHVFKETFGSAGQPSFGEAEGLAVDQSSGDLLVIDGEANTVSRYNPDGTPAEFSALGTNVIDGSETPQGAFSFGTPGEVQVAVDNSGGPTDGDIYVPQWELGSNVVDIFAADGSYLGQLTESSEGGFSFPCGVAVDPSGSLYVGDFSGQIRKFEPAANPAENADSSASFPFEGNCVLAAGAGPTAGSIFPVQFSGKVSKLDSTSGAEQYEIDAGPNTTVTVNPASGHLYTAAGGEVKEYDASGPSEATLLSSFSGTGNGKVMGIAVDEASGDVYVARAENPNIEVRGPAALLPDVTTEAASVIDGSVTLRGVVNAAGGPPATCVFEYVEVHAKGFEGATSVPCSPAGPFTGTVGAAVSAEIDGLPEAAFRFRLLASNAEGSLEGQTLLFNTSKDSGLPDNRAYEMISPPQKLGEVFPPDPELQFSGRWGKQCVDGECLPGVNAQLGPMQSTPDGERIVYAGQPFSSGLAAGPNEYLSRRSSGGWGIPQSLSPELASPGSSQGFKAFSTDLSRGVLYELERALSPEAPVREGEAFANLYLTDSSGSLRPLVAQAPPHREPGNLSSDFKVSYGGANAGSATVPAFSHVVFAADDALTGEVPDISPKAPEVEASSCVLPFESCNLYEWTDGELRLINVLPGNAAAVPGAVLGSGRLLPESTPAETYAPAVDHAISADGTRIFWTAEETDQLYVRIDGDRTEEIEDPGGFLTASSDGSKVLLNDGCLYDLEVELPTQPCEDLTSGQGEFEGILGANEDLSRIFFVDRAVLSGSEENANEEEAESGAFNLYAWHEGAITFIGRLSEGGNANVEDEDNQISGSFGFGAWKPSSLNRTAQVSPDGRFLAFMSKASLTGFDNEVSEVTGKGCRGEKSNGAKQGGIRCFEVFVYDADARRLTCASCNPMDQRPLGQSSLSLLRQPVGRQPANLSADGQGRLFFDSQDTLSTRDTNGAIQDVYEWEPNGVGSCSQANGCVALISSGHAVSDSFFLDGTPSGNDAFVVTRDQLLPQDKDTRLDLYDARVGGGIEAGTTAPCSGEACKGPVSGSPQLAAPASAAFSGPGNAKQAKHKKHKKHSKKKAKHSKKHKRTAKHNRGGAQ